MTYKPPSLPDLILATLMSAGSSKIFRHILRERRQKRLGRESIQVTLSRLKKQGYVKNSKLVWSLTSQGIERAKYVRLFDYLPSDFSRGATKNTIISFDIPEKKRAVRNWLRNQIKIYDYEMLQQSLWIGPGPLPLEFLERLGKLNIQKNIRTFRINKK